MKKYYIFFAILTTIIAGVAAYETIGTRNPLSDQQTETDLLAIQDRVDDYARKNNKLPEKLTDLNLDEKLAKRAEKYEYNVKSGSEYELCATFKTDTTKNSSYYGASFYEEDYPSYHKKGRQCFSKVPYSLEYPDYGSRNNNVTSNANDSERKTDIATLNSYLEVFYADNGYYPTLANLNDDSWVTSNLKGLDLDALKDPQGTSNDLVSSPKAKAYAYEVTPDGCDNVAAQCTAYKLTAKLVSGGTYTKESLN